MGLVSSGFGLGVSAIFGHVADANEAIIKLALFAVLFAVFARGAKRAFPENHTAANIVSAVVAIISIRMMPGVWLLPLGKTLWVLAVVLVPFVIVDSIMGKWTIVKIALLAAAYLGILLVVSSTGWLGFGPGFTLFGSSYEYWRYYHWQMTVAVAVLIVYVWWRWAKRQR